MIEYICSYCEKIHTTTKSYLNHINENHKDMDKMFSLSVDELTENTMKNTKYAEALKNKNESVSALNLQLDNVIMEFKQIIDGKPQNNVFHHNAYRSNNMHQDNTNQFNEKYQQQNNTNQFNEKYQQQNNISPQHRMQPTINKNDIQPNSLFPQGIFMNGTQQNIPQNIPPFIHNNQFDQEAFQKFIQSVCSQGNNTQMSPFPNMTSFTTTTSNAIPNNNNNTQLTQQSINEEEISDTDSDPNYENKYYRFMLEFTEKSPIHNVHIKELYDKFSKWYQLVTASNLEDVPSLKLFSKSIGEFYDVKKSVKIDGKIGIGIEGLNYKKPDEIFNGLL